VTFHRNSATVPVTVSRIQYSTSIVYRSISQTINQSIKRRESRFHIIFNKQIESTCQTDYCWLIAV